MIDIEEEKENQEIEEENYILNANYLQENENISNNSYIPKIRNLFEFIISENNKNKSIKISLFNIRGFDPSLIFKEIDNISSGFINEKDLEEYSLKNKINVEKDILHLFIRQFGKKENDNNLSQTDFIKFINFDINKTEIKFGEVNFDNNEIKTNFLNLIKAEFELIKGFKYLINEIIQIKEFSTYEAFNIISGNQNYIDNNNLKEFLENKYSSNEIQELIYRIDLNNDKRINYEEFQDFFFPYQTHLDIDLEIKNEENRNTKEKKFYIYSNPYKNNILLNPNIVSENSEENEIKINYNNYYDKEKEFNEEKINIEEKKEYNDENIEIKYDENLLNEINNELSADNDEKYYNLKLKYDEDINRTSKIIKDLNMIYKEDSISLNKENKEKTNNLSSQIINKDNKKIYEQKNSLSKSDILSQKNNLYLNYFPETEINKVALITEKDKYIIKFFIDYIHSLIILENISENIKESISLCTDISLSNIFNFFNKDKDDLISKNNFILSCKTKFYIYPSEFQIKLLYDRYDIDNDGLLNFDEFMKMVSPLKEEYLALNQKKDKFKNMKDIDFSTKKKVIELIKRLIDNESLIYDLKNKLLNEKNFNFVFLWGIMMKFSQDEKKLNKKEFNSFLEKFQCFLTDYELDIIFYKFSKGKNVIKYNSLYKEIISYN